MRAKIALALLYAMVTGHAALSNRLLRAGQLRLPLGVN